jgi:hypothetical protein
LAYRRVVDVDPGDGSLDYVSSGLIEFDMMFIEEKENREYENEATQADCPRIGAGSFAEP